MQTTRQITQIITFGIGAIVLMALAGCSEMEGGAGSSSMAKASAPKPKDGELAQVPLRGAASRCQAGS
ncbi:MAG: hypothetical protein Q8L77_03025 [Nitrospirota bacterium]|nr:hypothetical protein [Nitrospirota bacterium]